MEKSKILEYLDEWYYTANEEELVHIIDFVSGVEADLQYFDKIDTTGIEPAHWAFDVEVDYLREDVVNHLLSNEEALANAASTQDGYVKYVKVV